jgi:hypothetical protein
MGAFARRADAFARHDVSFAAREGPDACTARMVRMARSAPKAACGRAPGCICASSAHVALALAWLAAHNPARGLRAPQHELNTKAFPKIDRT